jgi:hypothetical protein
VAEGGFLGRGNAGPVHNTAQYPFQDVMAQRGVCSKCPAPHPMVSAGMAEAGTAVTLDGGGIRGQIANAEAVAEASTDFPTLELQGPGEGECTEPG